MAEEQCNLQRISWAETFPFVRLFATFKRAVSFWPMVLALLAVLACYVSGRVMDAIWKAADGGVLLAEGQPEVHGDSGRVVARILATRGATVEDEIRAYVTQDAAGFADWKRSATDRWAALQEEPEEEAEAPETPEADAAFPDQVAQRLESGLARLDEDTELEAEEKERRRDELRQAADLLCLAFAGKGLGVSAPIGEKRAAMNTVLAAAGLEADQQREEQGAWLSALAKSAQEARKHQLTPRGPFICLLEYEMNCFAAAIQGVCNGRWGLSGSALSDEPAMVGSIASAGSGVLWLVTQRPCYSVFLTLIYLVIFALGGGAICRVTAVRTTRDESMPIRAAIQFSFQKLGALVAAPLLPVAIFLVVTLFVFLFSALFGATPFLRIVAGPIYGLALLVGVLLAFTLVGVVAGFHLMWPTIAVEASDAFDAVQRAISYVFQRAWHVGFYSFVLLLYGGVSFVIVRLIGMLVLKLSHVTTGLGMNLATSARVSTMDRLDAIWQMPNWQDLPLLPAVAGTNFWGSFGHAPLSGPESFTAFFIMLWVYGFVALVGAFVVSFYFCGSTEMYLLLRREVDAVDYDEIYYEESEEDFEPEGAAAEAATPSEAAQPQAADGPAEPKGAAASGESEAAEKPKKPRKPRRPRKPPESKDTEDAGFEEATGESPSD